MIKKITKLRNACAHNDASFVSNDGNDIREIKDLMVRIDTVFSADGKQVNFKNGALHILTDELRKYFTDVDAALKSFSKAV